ncbi:uncharacterized protein [Drosophila tropicalis]|uniref:uncharacterized protein n=1 Tax=Drosophila tropicalis TaxID=46794 RepID=UPI0035ABA7C0
MFDEGDVSYGLDCECDRSSISMEGAPMGKEVSSDAFGDRLCTSFCHQRRNTLPGCSPCQLIVAKVIDVDKKMALKASEMQSTTTHGANASDYLTKVEQALANAVEAVAEETTDTPDWNELCKVLCKTGDGGSLCNYGLDCECDRSSISMEGAPMGKEVSSDAFGDRLCTSFCHQRRNTLPGCSPCQLIVAKVIDVDKKMALKASEMQSTTTHGANASDYLTKVEQALANAVEAVAEETTDTPDWNELCKVLCKTGDGGSLCNCDLSPFST